MNLKAGGRGEGRGVVYRSCYRARIILGETPSGALPDLSYVTLKASPRYHQSSDNGGRPKGEPAKSEASRLIVEYGPCVRAAVRDTMETFAPLWQTACRTRGFLENKSYPVAPPSQPFLSSPPRRWRGRVNAAQITPVNSSAVANFSLFRNRMVPRASSSEFPRTLGRRCRDNIAAAREPLEAFRPRTMAAGASSLSPQSALSPSLFHPHVRFRKLARGIA